MSAIHNIITNVNPTAAPDRAGQHWVNSTLKRTWFSVGTATVADWKEITALLAQDEGVDLSAAVSKINFAGAGVTATQPSAGEILVTIPGGGGGASTWISSAYQNTAQTISPGGVYKVLIDTASRDVHSLFDATNKKWVIPTVTGTVDVEVTAHVRTGTNAAGQPMLLAVYKNGALVEEGAPFTSASGGGSGAHVRWNGTAITGDYFEIYLYQNFGGTITTTAVAGYTEGTLKIFNQ